MLHKVMRTLFECSGMSLNVRVQRTASTGGPTSRHPDTKLEPGDGGDDDSEQAS
jgi:hypothetical protein